MVVDDGDGGCAEVHRVDGDWLHVLQVDVDGVDFRGQGGGLEDKVGGDELVDGELHLCGWASELARDGGSGMEVERRRRVGVEI